MYDDEYYMRKAIEAAREGIRMHEFPFGCCLVTKNHVITMSNKCFSSNNATLHAEVNAINEMLRLENTSVLEDAVIYTTTEPCVMCLGAINWVRIRKLVCGMSINESAEYGFKEINVNINSLIERFPYDIEVKSGVLHAECAELYQEWAQKNRIMYRMFQRNKVISKVEGVN